MSVGKTLLHCCFPVAKRSFPDLHATPAIPSPPSARARAHHLKNFPLEKGSKGAPARGRWGSSAEETREKGAGVDKKDGDAVQKRENRLYLLLFLNLNFYSQEKKKNNHKNSLQLTMNFFFFNS